MEHETERTEKITVELAKEQGEFLEWAAKLEGVTRQEYLAKAANGRLIKPAEESQD
jgi:uncharacterized protein (DUF1778 family)